MTAISVAGLSNRFRQPVAYRPSGQPSPLPLRFLQFDASRYIATNLAGEYVLLHRETLEGLIRSTIGPEDPVYPELLSKHFILQDGSDSALDLLATKYRTKQMHLAEFTGLHIFVITLRCEHSCSYCQVSRVSTNKTAYDMTAETASRATDLMFRSPNRHLKVEFQGGEPLLNFDLIRSIVLDVEHRNIVERRDIEFVIATNLALITEEMLVFCKDHGITLSTSLDGPRELHNANRPRPGGDSYERTVTGISRCREVLGHDAVSALMTTTRESLERPEAIIDEYLSQGFDSIFLRWLSPYGFAARTVARLGYGVDDWNRFYERSLRYILGLNRTGKPIREEYATIILRKILTPFPTGYVDLQSPAGLGIAVAVYNYDGYIYASDEGRMLAETGDRTFCLGSVHRDSYEDIFLSDRLVEILLSTMTEGTPSCVDCAFEPYCGTDPVFHHATQGNMVGHRPTSAFCSRNMFIIKFLIKLLEDDADARPILEGWVR